MKTTWTCPKCPSATRVGYFQQLMDETIAVDPHPRKLPGFHWCQK